MAFNLLLQGVEQCPKQHAVSLENACICAFHPEGDISTANGTKICTLVLAM